MKLVRGIENLPAEAVGCVLTLGNFDGVHCGHREIVATTRRIADQMRAAAVALTFDPHPAAVLRPDAAPPAIVTLAHKVALLRQYGVDWVVVLTFDQILAETSHADFTEHVLRQRLAVRHVVVGEQARFGKGRLGNASTLREFGSKADFGVTEVGLLQLDGVPVSSSAIRAAIAQGEVERANRMLGWPYQVDGTVVHGEARGRQIGVPTANLKSEMALLPENGVYVCRADLDGASRLAVANIGYRPTFEGEHATVEVHLLDFDGEIYGRELSVMFLSRLRNEMKFPSVDALVNQIRLDIAAAREWGER